MRLLRDNPTFASAFFEQIERANKRAEEEAKHRAEVADEDMPAMSEVNRIGIMKLLEGKGE